MPLTSPRSVKQTIIVYIDDEELSTFEGVRAEHSGVELFRAEPLFRLTQTPDVCWSFRYLGRDTNSDSELRDDLAMLPAIVQTLACMTEVSPSRNPPKIDFRAIRRHKRSALLRNGALKKKCYATYAIPKSV